jgi:hypothetical protein
VTKNRKVVLAVLLIVIIWVPLLYSFENSVIDLSGLHFWLRVLIGGWPVVDAAHPEKSIWFTCAITLALLLRLGPLWLLVEMAVMIARSLKDKNMNIAQSLVLRDRSIKNSILTQFSESDRTEIRRKIEAAFKNGNSMWENKHLVTALGKDGAEKLKETLAKDIS